MEIQKGPQSQKIQALFAVVSPEQMFESLLRNALYNTGIGSRHCGIKMSLEGTKTKWTAKKI